VSDIEKIRLDMRIKAVEGVVTTLLALRCLEQAPTDPLGAFAKMRTQLSATMKIWVFPELRDPAMSDLQAAELEDAVTLLLESVATQIAELQKRPENLPQ
jgi:hypothetical protein